MKNKIIIASTIIIVLIGGFLFGRQWLNKSNPSEVDQFVKTFIYSLENKPADSVVTLFDVKQKKKDLLRLVDVLAGRTSSNGRSKQLFKRKLDSMKVEVKVISDSQSEVVIPLILSYEGLYDLKSSIKLTLQKRDKKEYKIIQFNGEDLYTDFVAYENAIRSLTIPDKDIYDPLTLTAFEGAEKLKGKYDSVIWFSYLDNKPLYYVVNGEWSMPENLFGEENREEKPYQMGLVSADFKEIIPARFDLIHNINGTFEGLIEVEKNGKRGFYDLQGKNIVPVEYDQIIPIEDGEKVAVVGSGTDYFWLNKDFSVSERDSSIKISDILKKVYVYRNTYNISENNVKNLIEFNSRQDHNALYIPPSHLSDWGILSRAQQFKNPLRHNVEFYDMSSSVQVKFAKTDEDSNWLETVLSSIRDNYVGGRSDFYEKKNVMMIDHRNNKLYSYTIWEDEEMGEAVNCNNIFQTRALSDTLIEVKTSGSNYLGISGKDLTEMPFYHYISLKTGKAEGLPSKRYFNFTEYVKLNDSYIKGCYVYGGKQLDKLPKDVLTFMKMEIYANYNYNFPDNKWNEVFNDIYGVYKPENSDVEQYLTEIDKYNIKWLDQRIKGQSSEKLAISK
ncbi:WG repeat-containing protein [Desertivirga arenae]|uniref:WG repeat-containing protein n=1 Tax=Desertivirga arenae TaxID=2810309 RepID=UPI001A9794F8|nr:WG repeat-containing protein [Pedobacter sp. SYSU D00823]